MVDAVAHAEKYLYEQPKQSEETEMEERLQPLGGPQSRYIASVRMNEEKTHTRN